MTRSSLLGAAILLLAATAAGAGPGPCDARRPGSCLVPGVDLSTVPDISQQIIADESGKPTAKTPALQPADPTTPYTGPTLGITRLPRPAPTVGYHWSLD